jgi:hypothetical protein
VSIDAEAAVTTAEHALGPYASLAIRHVRKVPETCPACGSHRLSPERGLHTDVPGAVWERPVCDTCGWTGEPVEVTLEPIPPADHRQMPEGECIGQLCRCAGSQSLQAIGAGRARWPVLAPADHIVRNKTGTQDRNGLAPAPIIAAGCAGDCATSTFGRYMTAR